MKCCAYLISESIDLSKLEEKSFRQVALIRQQEDIIFVFPYGVIINWGSGNLFSVEKIIENSLVKPFDTINRIFDEFSVEIKDSEKLISEDIIYLSELNENIMLTISHAIAQSIRLSFLEDAVLKDLKTNTLISENLARHGKIKKSKKEISKLQGDLYLKKLKMSFEYSILDKPEFFWENPEYDQFYVKASEYLEIAPRVQILEKKMTTIDEMLSILSGEINHRHSSRLEWIIIILILIEIIIFFAQDVFKLI